MENKIGILYSESLEKFILVMPLKNDNYLTDSYLKNFTYLNCSDETAEQMGNLCGSKIFDSNNTIDPDGPYCAEDEKKHNEVEYFQGSFEFSIKNNIIKILTPYIKRDYSEFD